MTLGELYFKNGNIDLLDDVALNIGRQLLTGKLYQFDMYFNFQVYSVDGISHNIYYISECRDDRDKSFKELVMLYSTSYFLNGCVDVYIDGSFFNSLPILDILKYEWSDRCDYSFKGNSVFFDKNLLSL